MDATPFGEFRTWDKGKDFGVLWEEMRDIFKVVVEFDGLAPSPASVKLQYWQSNWPWRNIPRKEASGSGNSGWLSIGDWFKGVWLTADSNLKVDGNTWTYTFNDVRAKEALTFKDFEAKYRATYKVRMLFDGVSPKVKQFRAFTDSTWDKMDATVEWGGAGTMPQDWSGKAEAFNGYVASVQPASENVKMAGPASWTSGVDGKTDGVHVSFWYVKPESINSFDETIITLRCKQRSFSFAAKDLAQNKKVFIRDYGVLVKRAEDTTAYALMEEGYAKAPKDIYRRVEEMPEQNLPRAWSSIPQKVRIYMPVCVEGGRQYFRLHADGMIMHDKAWLNRVKSTDTPKADWSKAITLRFGIPLGQRSGATIEDGYLPIPTTWWENNGLRVTQTIFATTMAGKLPPEGRVPGDEPLACMVKLTITNYNGEARKLRLPLRSHLVERGDMATWAEIIADEKLYEPLVDKDGVVSGHTDKDRARFYVNTNGVATLTPNGTILYCDVETPAKETRTFYVTIPFLTPDTAQEFAQLKALDYDKQHKMIASYWRKRAQQGCEIVTPEPMLNDFYSANSSHQLINTQNEVGHTKTAMANVGTGSYGVFANESIMMITELDRRGYHDVAEKALQSFIDYQGTRGLLGDYLTKDGVYTGSNGYDDGDYNQNQGWVLWGMAEHYWFTRDNDWLKRSAASIVKGCDWLLNERKRSFTDEAVGIRSIERGLQPNGSLEDITDYRCWMSNNDFQYWGLESAGKALKEINHPDADRITSEAARYKKDIIDAFWEATVRCPVVGLRDGTYIPYTPSDVHRRGRAWGWISETLEGGIYLIRTGVVDPDGDWAKWIMRDYEDNRYLSQQYGYQAPFFERDWFSIGGFSQQPNLLCSPTPYLLIDNPKLYLRAYFNSFASAYFPERAMLTEHPLPNLGNFQGGHFKTSDEALNSSWLRWMFIYDEGTDLYLGQMMPRYWLADGKEVKIERAATHFGPMSMSMKSEVAKGRITMTIDPPTRNVPPTIYARFRHPEGKSMNRVTVNGKPWDKFDAEKEWVVLPGLAGKTVVVAYYD